MHLLIPFAGLSSDAGQEALRHVALPNLALLLARLTQTQVDSADETTLSPPHERVLGRLLGWRAEDGCWPWAAFHATADGIETGDLPWAELTPVNVHVGTDQLTLMDPAALALQPEESRAAFEAVRELFESAGWRVAWGGTTRWYASHLSVAGLPTASLDRVVGRDIDAFMPRGPAARPVRALQNEVQMLLYQWAPNDARSAQGALPINSFWVSGCGVRQPAAALPDLTVAEHLRAPALSGDWPAWVDAWSALDAREVADCLARLQDGDGPVALTLCGEREARTFEARRLGLAEKLRRRFSRVDPVAILGQL